MFGSSIIEVAIGLVLVYLLLSIICSAIQESLEARLKIRASHLEMGLRELLQDSDGTRLLKQIYNHPMIYGLFRGDYDPAKVRGSFTSKLPTYIQPANFAIALIDTLVRGPVERDPDKKDPPATGELSCDSLRAAIVNNDSLNASVQRVLLLALDSAKGDLAKVQASVEAWFNSGMERVSGWYKRRMQVVLLGLGLVVAVFFNVDTTKIARELYKNDALRASVVAQAEAVTKSDKPPTADVQKLFGSLNDLNLPIGWQKKNQDSWITVFIDSVPTSSAGWLLTAFAISFGAPFWFDLLNKLMVLRSTVKPQDTAPKADSKTPQAQENKSMTLQGTPEEAAASATSTAVLAAMDGSTFQSHEWATGDDPQGGAL